MCLEPGALQSHVIQDGPAWLLPRARNHYCFGCIREDVIQGRQPYFRIEWFKSHTTVCPLHKIAMLTINRRRTSKGQLLPVDLIQAVQGNVLGGLMLSESWHGREFASLLVDWESRLGELISEFGGLPSCSDPIAQLVGRALTLFGSVHGTYPSQLSAGQLTPLNAGWSFTRQIGGAEVLEPSTRDQAWDRFRGIRSINNRRAAVWLAAGTLNGYLDLDWWAGAGLRPTRSANLDWWHQVLRPRLTLEAMPEAMDLWRAIHRRGAAVGPDELPGFPRRLGLETAAA